MNTFRKTRPQRQAVYEAEQKQQQKYSMSAGKKIFSIF